MSAIAIIPARGGSTRILRKNIRDFRGQPIIAYSIRTAQDSGAFNAVVVSTDDDEIARVALKLGAAVVWRDYDDGKKGTQAVAADVLRQLPGFDLACVVYPCAPLLLPTDLTAAAGVLAQKLFCFGVGVDPLTDAGAFYFGRSNAFGTSPLYGPGSVLFPLPPERVCDINTEDDWAKAELMYDALRRAP